jgi:hypothetical protein
MNMSKLIERLESSVAYAENQGENMDDVSWNYQEGILISYNEAKAIVAAMKRDHYPAKADIKTGECRICGSLDWACDSDSHK